MDMEFTNEEIDELITLVSEKMDKVSSNNRIERLENIKMKLESEVAHL